MKNKLPIILKELREENKVTQTELAKAVGGTQTTINRIEHGITDPTGDYLVRLGDFFNVSVDYLLGRTTIKELNNDVSTSKSAIKSALNQFFEDNPKIYSEIRDGVISSLTKKGK